MSKSYPNRQTLIIAIICLGAVSATLLYIRPELLSQKSNWQNIQIEPKSTISAPQNFIESSESDWKKAFELTSSTTDLTTKDKPLTITDQLGRDFFTKYVELRQNNLTTDDQSVAKAMDQTISSAINLVPKAKVYNLTNITINTSYNNDSLRIYANTVGSVFAKNAPKIDPTSIANEALEQENSLVLEKLKPVISSYDKLIKGIIITPVPAPLASYHLDLINSLSSMLFVSQELQYMISDPMRGVVALNQYVLARENISKALVKTSGYLNDKEIFFTNQEPGIFFATVQ